jgi:penicillin amidase
MVAGAVARYAFDLSDWDQSGWVVPLGANGEPGTPHYADQQPAWAEGTLHSAPYTRGAVDNAATATVGLHPG